MLLRQIISWARQHHDTDAAVTSPVCGSPKTRVAVTASTGMAAVNIGGVTLHSWAGIGLGNGKLDDYVKGIKFGSGTWEKIRDRWQRTKTLIIDESNVPICSPDALANDMDSIYDRLRSV